MKSILRSLAEALAFAAGVAILLGLVLDGGLLGDPAYLRVGRHADRDALGRARVELGVWHRWQANVLTIDLADASTNLQLQARGPVLILDDHIFEADNAQDLAKEWNHWVPGIRVQTQHPDLSTAGIATALGNQSLDLHAGQHLSLGWAEDAPVLPRVFSAVGRLLRFDLGETLDGRKIAAEIARRAPRSLALAIPAFLLTTLLTLSLALFSVLRAGAMDRRLASIAALVMAISPLAWILAFQHFFANTLEWFPTQGWLSPWWPYAVLPVLVWVVAASGGEFRFWRSLAQELAQGPELQAARARGLDPRALARRHLFPQLAIPLLVRTTLALPWLVLGSLLLERIFGIPGLGDWTTQAALSGDREALRATVFLIALAWLLLQKGTDAWSKKLDPRGELGQ